MQFRELEFLSGSKDPSFVRRFKGLTDDERQRLQRRLDEPTLWDAFLSVLDARGLPVGGEDEVTASVRRAAHDRSSYGDVWALAEALLQHDELAAAWRARHVVMVERMIGTKTGTGGSHRRRLPPQPSRPALLPAAVGSSARCCEPALTRRSGTGVGRARADALGSG